MWYTPTVTVAPTDEPVTIDEAKRQVRAVEFDDDDTYLADLIAVARNHVEKYCGATFATQTVEVKTDGWRDMAHLSVGPVQSVTSISYVDASGAEQTLADTVYELRGDAIVLKYGQSWPAVQSRSLITLTAIVGLETAPPAVKHAILLRIADLYEFRESEDDSKWTSFDSLLSNHRYY
ncbi:phage head-tail connector protein [Mesorhizobium sp. BR1-1-12]|uniref:head-tail connector protein n=1 Tax=Mesorhizobium sp. BR1-1-12 TaxID=2876657 RepID=UPI001CD11D98|nr:phage head-tail connector protein [Mesorhizobium sp. BR1-1-12]MBZ9973504.1 phage head-tail connector protein [Mesorhizobium sp. BR1-1-12]